MATHDNGDGGHGPIISWRHRITALVIDSGMFFRTFEKGMLNAYGTEAEAVETGDAAAELIYGGQQYDLIVVGAYMDDPAGIETTRQLRHMGVESLIVGLTEEYSEAERAAFINAGADAYIEKPFTPERFVPILAEIDNEP